MQALRGWYLAVGLLQGLRGAKRCEVRLEDLNKAFWIPAQSHVQVLMPASLIAVLLDMLSITTPTSSSGIDCFASRQEQQRGVCE